MSTNRAQLTILKSDELSSKDDWSLIWTCVSPFVFMVREKSELMRMTVYEGLSDHQKRLFIFTVYYNHARQSVDDFIYYNKLLLENNYWNDLKAAMDFFGDHEMMLLLEQIEAEMKKSSAAVAAEIPIDASWASSTRSLFKAFMSASDKTLKLIGDDIRRNPMVYFHLKN